MDVISKRMLVVTCSGWVMAGVKPALWFPAGDGYLSGWYIYLRRGLKVVTDRNDIEKIIEQELSSILLQSVKLAEKERRPAAKAALQIILRVIDARREGREKAKLNELRG